jgi:hypothetical protein
MQKTSYKRDPQSKRSLTMFGLRSIPWNKVLNTDNLIELTYKVENLKSRITTALETFRKRKGE